MKSLDVLVANLTNQEGGPSSIRFQNIDNCTTGHADRECPDILGFHSLADGRLSSGPPDDKHNKAFSRGKKGALRVVELLNGKGQTTFQPRERIDDGDGVEIPFIQAGHTALVGGPPCDGRAREMEGISSYQKMDFHFSNPSAHPRNGVFISSQHLHFTCPGLKAEDALYTKDGTPAFDHVEIMSGICLFSAKILASSFLEDGRIDVDKILYAKPTLYEMEYIARSSSAIADVASIIILRGRQIGFSSVPVTIILDVPSFHYYQSIDETLERGLCTAREALQWIDAVELRYDQVSQVFVNSVRHELSQRGVGPEYSCKVHISPRTNLVSSSIRQALQKGKNPTLDGILQSLNSIQDEGVWRDFYKLLAPNEVPRTFRALGYLFYIFQVVRPALLKSKKMQSRRESSAESSTSGSASPGPSQPHFYPEDGKKPRCLLISIDDGVERRIYSRAQKLLKKLRNHSDSGTHPTLVEMYLSRRVFINSNETGSNLYLGDPTPEGLTTSRSDAHKGEITGDGFSPFPKLAPVDVVRILYGYECANNIQKWFVEVGL